MKSDIFKRGTLLLEAIFLIEPASSIALQSARYFPPTIIRIVIDKEGKNYNSVLSHESINESAIPVDEETAINVIRDQVNDLKDMVKYCEQQALSPAKKLLDAAHQRGYELLNKEVFADFNILTLPGGNTGCQMGGWFRKPVPNLKSLNGIKMRIPGFGGKIMARMGVNVQTLAGAEIYPALERGVIDATEWVGPYDDMKLGFYQVAKYYYAPSWWEPNAQLSLYINRKAWNSLPKEYQHAISVAAAESNQSMLAEYDARNPKALRDLLAKGVHLETFSNDIMQAASNHATDIYQELSSKDKTWRKVYAHWNKFRQTEFAWFNANEMRYADFAMGHAPLKDL
ncbi:MAG: TRAP transporter substrate-binding protein DctP [Gammaproteobacteria bacterium]